MKLIDSHCHLDFKPLSGELREVLKRADEAGVYKMINIGTSLLRSSEVVEIAEQYPNVWASIGVHPEEAESISSIDEALSVLRSLAKKNKVVAIGEIGLDYNQSHEPLTIDHKNKQKELFVAQLELAQVLKLPVIIHVRDAWEDLFEIIQNKKYKIKNGAVIHCFTGDEFIAQKLTDLGFLLGFTGFITFNQAKYDYIRKAVETAPLEKILIETDAPFLAPEPHRGKSNEPALVFEIAKKIADIKGISLEEVAETTTKNAEKLFNMSS